MSATAWFVIAIVGFSLAGIALVAAIILFIKMDIPAIIGDLTGKTVAREIEAMRESNAASGDKRFRSSAVNLERGTLTEKVTHNAEAMKIAHASKRLDKTDALDKSGKTGHRKGGTTGLSSQNSVVNPVFDDNPAPATEKLSDNVTEVLSDGVTDVLSPATEDLSNPTEVLSSGTTVLGGGTTVLNGTDELAGEEIVPVTFKTVRSEVMIHADEVIE